ncbi:Late histone H2A.L3, partial [Apaloderma vittatum]
ASKRNRSAKAGLQFPVSRVYRFLKRGNYSKRVSPSAAIYLAAVLQYLSRKILEAAGKTAKENKHRILPKHILLVVRNDENLNKLFSGVTIAQGGVLPNLPPELLRTKSSS